jgi:hypothetical protein
MGYQTALDKSWQGLGVLGKTERFTVKFLSDYYDIDINSRKVLSSACNVLAKDYLAILILHYLIKKLEGLPELIGDWISFKELPGGDGYYDAFRKRSLDPIIRKYGRNPKGLSDCLERLPAKVARYGDCAIILDVFENVPVLITVWGQDEEFTAETNMLFDRSIANIFCTEDVAVLSTILAGMV